MSSTAFGFPAALDNRPLKFEEFEQMINQCVYVSATPGKLELERTGGEVIEQIIRPTGLIDPVIEIHPARPGAAPAGIDQRSRGVGRARTCHGIDEEAQ